MSGQGMKRGSEGNAGGGGGKKMRGDSVTLRFLLQSKHAGGIIGKGGQTIKRLRSEYNATVSVPDTNAPERVLSIAASQENAIQVLRECLPLCHEPPYQISGGGGGSGAGQNQGGGGGGGGNQFEINFLVHSSQVGGIIGRSGCNIKDLRETTGTNIKVFQECLPNSTERVVAIGASSEDGVIEVIRKILVIMQEQQIKGNINLYDPSMEPWNVDQGQGYGAPMHGRGGGRGGGMRAGRGRGGGRGGFGGPGGFGGGGNFNGPMDGMNQGNNVGFNYGGGPQENFGDFNQGGGGGGAEGANYGKGNTETTQVTIPNDLAGAIIGKGGERIRNIRQRSGADIKIQDPLPGKADRVITITGNPEQIQYGQFLMQQSVRQFSGKHTT